MERQDALPNSYTLQPVVKRRADDSVWSVGLLVVTLYGLILVKELVQLPWTTIIADAEEEDLKIKITVFIKKMCYYDLGKLCVDFTVVNTPSVAGSKEVPSARRDRGGSQFVQNQKCSALNGWVCLSMVPACSHTTDVQSSLLVCSLLKQNKPQGKLAY